MALVGAVVVMALTFAVSSFEPDGQPAGSPASAIAARDRSPDPSDPGIDPPHDSPNPEDFDTVDGELVRWDACGPIDWLVHRGPGPADARELAEAALEQVADATGLEFRYAGTIDEVVDDDAPDGTERTIFISWATPEEVPALDGAVVGIGGTAHQAVGDGPMRPLWGRVVLDTTDGLDPGFEGGASHGAVLLHEMGHVLGLAHSDDPDEVMYHAANPDLPAVYQPGDLEALASAVEQRPCA
jgi:hypothetical protein